MLVLDPFVGSVLFRHNFASMLRITRGNFTAVSGYFSADTIRGIPGGYLGALETRLNETEIALYNALCELRQLKTERTFTDHPDLSEPLQARQGNSNKYSRMTEWVTYPLRSSSELAVWWSSFDNIKQPKGMCNKQKPLYLSCTEIISGRFECGAARHGRDPSQRASRR
jgi:hypothetical protein